MNSSLRVFAVAGAAVVLFDIVTATISRLAHFNHSSFYFLSWLVYLAIGIFAARKKVSVLQTGALAGFIDASLGWWITSHLAPNTHIQRTVTVAGWVIVAVLVMLSSIFFAGVGYLIESYLLSRSRPKDAAL